jgi:hypothetical protein
MVRAMMLALGAAVLQLMCVPITAGTASTSLQRARAPPADEYTDATSCSWAAAIRAHPRPAETLTLTLAADMNDQLPGRIEIEADHMRVVVRANSSSSSGSGAKGKPWLKTSGIQVSAGMLALIGITMRSTGAFIRLPPTGNAGGALAVYGSASASITDVRFENLTSFWGGGAVFVGTAGTVELRHVVVDSCSASFGGALWIVQAKHVSISDCMFTRNMAVDGGAIAITAGDAELLSLVLQGSVFRYNRANVDLTNGTLDKNAPPNPGSFLGPAIYWSGRANRQYFTDADALEAQPIRTRGGDGQPPAAGQQCLLPLRLGAEGYFGSDPDAWLAAIEAQASVESSKAPSAAEYVLCLAQNMSGARLVLNISGGQNVSAVGNATPAADRDNVVQHVVQLQVGFAVHRGHLGLQGVLLRDQFSGYGNAGGAVVIASTGSASVHNCSFVNNTAHKGGGAMFVATAGTVVVRHTLFLGCMTGYGGAIWVAEVSDMLIHGCVFTDDVAFEGGALYISATEGSSIRLEHSSFRGNNCTRSVDGRGGGAICWSGQSPECMENAAANASQPIVQRGTARAGDLEERQGGIQLTWEVPVTIARSFSCMMAMGKIIGFQDTTTTAQSSTGREGLQSGGELLIQVTQACAAYPGWSGGCSFKNCTQAFVSNSHGKRWRASPALEGSPCLGGGGSSTVVGQFGKSLRLLSQSCPPIEDNNTDTDGRETQRVSVLELKQLGNQEYSCVAGGDGQHATLSGLPVLDASNGRRPACLPTGQPAMNTIATRFLQKKDGSYLGFWAGPDRTSNTTQCGFWARSGPPVFPQCCQRGTFFSSIDGLQWNYSGSFDSVQRCPLASWGQACTAHPGSYNITAQCGVQISAAGEANTAVELDDGRLLTVYRQTSCGLPLVKSYSDSSGRSWSVGQPMLASDSKNVQGIGTVRGQLLRLSTGKLVMVSGRPGLGLWVAKDAGGTEWEVFSVVAAFNKLQVSHG